MKPEYCKHPNSLLKWIYILRPVISILIILVFFSGGAYGQTTWYSYQSGNWGTPSTWTADPSGTLLIGSPAVEPGASDKVIILNGRTVNITANTKSAASITIQPGAVLNTNATIGHTFNIINGAGIYRLSSPNLVIPAPIGTFFQPGGGTVEYSGTGALPYFKVLHSIT